ncbi:hypothetical protein QVD17_39015 [Tagetes erecta]|uniref:Uncharacterized protein n=1 Tax=Tagetes erecta TaxID=13708 RepID=A0AAD8JPY0_TARER|nr:hypothetical protein QVD17_39015 [Tagetes erecta]
MESCQSSESGWTMYIGSSSNDDDDESGSGGGGYGGGGRKVTVVENDDVDTDDSMASDASSGPGRGETEDVKGKYNVLSKKYKKPMQKKKVGREEEKELVNDQKGVVRSVQSRNSVWFLGRRK